MNEAPSNQSGMADTFSSQPSPQTNPFTADLKGEFTSNFGTNTNAVSQIFKEGGFVNQSRTKYLIIGGVVIAVLAIVFFFLTNGSSDPEDGDLGGEGGETAGDTDGDSDTDGDTTAGDKTDTEDSASTDTEASTSTETAETGDAAGDADTKSGGAAVPTSVPSYGGGGSSFSSGSGALSLVEPANGSSLNYDETQGAAVFSWTGGSGYILFSRNQSMNPPALRMPVSGGSYAFQHPWPGTWYWKVENKAGGTEVRSFSVTAPARRNVAVTQPASGAAVTGNGGVVTWQGDSKVAYYRVELTTGSWAAPQHRFASSGNSVQLNGVAPGQYQMRLGAFSEVSGRWEYTSPAPLTVQ